MGSNVLYNEAIGVFRSAGALFARTNSFSFCDAADGGHGGAFLVGDGDGPPCLGSVRATATVDATVNPEVTMPAKPFPTHCQIILTPQEHSGLDSLYALATQLIAEMELLLEVIAAGIRVKNREFEEKGDTTSPTRTEREASKRTVASRSTRDGASKSTAPSPHRHVELYLGFPISEGLRQKFEEYLDEHPTVSEETAGAFLLYQGLYRDEEMTADVDDIEDPSAMSSADTDPGTKSFSIPDEMRREVEAFQTVFPSMSEVAALRVLIRVGLREARRYIETKRFLEASEAAIEVSQIGGTPPPKRTARALRRMRLLRGLLGNAR